MVTKKLTEKNAKYVCAAEAFRPTIEIKVVPFNERAEWFLRNYADGAYGKTGEDIANEFRTYNDNFDLASFNIQDSFTKEYIEEFPPVYITEKWNDVITGENGDGVTMAYGDDEEDVWRRGEYKFLNSGELRNGYAYILSLYNKDGAQLRKMNYGHRWTNKQIDALVNEDNLREALRFQYSMLTPEEVNLAIKQALRDFERKLIVNDRIKF